MATSSALPLRKPRKQVYGRLNGRSNWNVSSFFDEEESHTSKPSQAARRAASPVNRSSRSKSPLMKTYGAEPGPPPPPKRQDTFDVPSSDDGRDEFTTIVSAPGFKLKNTLIDDSDSTTAQLAPWERRKVKYSQTVTSRGPGQAPASPEAQLKQDLERATLSPERNHEVSLSPYATSHSQRGISGEASPARISSPMEASAAARLAARRKDESHLLSKRTALSIDEAEVTSRKRARNSELSYTRDDNTYSLAEPTCEMVQQGHETAHELSNVYDLPASSEEDEPASRTASKVIKKPAKRSKKVAYSSKRTMKKGTSAPARLAEMTSIDTDTTDPPSRSPSTSRRSTPHKLPFTPPIDKASTPETAVNAKLHLTPKQSQLWSQLLPSENAVPSPSALALTDLRISGNRRSQATSSSRKLSKSQLDVPVRRTRLVDHLKASSRSSDNEFSDDEQATVDVTEVEGSKDILPEKPAALERKPSQISQPQSQTGIARGPKITYATTRSFLPEENRQEDFLAELDSPIIPHVTDQVSSRKALSAAKKSPFDIDNLEDEGGSQGGIRTIHELRASGRTVSGMYDIQELLSEIQNHSISQRGRRRGALIELANKLTDKAFATRFVGQSMDAELALECGAVSDEIADFLLAAAMTLILASEPPEHTIRTLQDQGVVNWLAKLLDRTSDIRFTVKDRRNNMSKSAQGSLIGFANALMRLQTLWHENEPKEITSRLVALRALDLLIGKVRHLGDRSELIRSDKVQQVLSARSQLSNSAEHAETVLAISVLESLSTTPAALNWPSSSIETISELLPLLSAESAKQRHSLFLALRLCLNLTNESSRNCEVLVKQSAVIDTLMNTIKQGFDSLSTAIDNEKRALALDLVVLALGITINIAEKSETARGHMIRDEDMLLSLLAIFERGQQHMLDAESVEESVSNVAFGYLAVMLSNLCQDGNAKTFIASKLPGKNLGMLVDAVEEFVVHHQKVDQLDFEGEEGAAVWGAFTEKLKAVLDRLQGSG